MSAPYLNVIGTGDSLEWLKQVPSNSVDSCACDPPYGLGDPPPIAAVVLAWARGKDFIPEGTGFLDKAWDAFVPSPAIWREVLRILKPGAFLLAFFGSRTYDIGVLAIRFAGFEIVDGLMWIHGTGWPKSQNISMALDKDAGHRQSDKDAPASPEGRAWKGWGTALKPAHEPIVLARKPFEGTYVANILKHQTGAINIDASRVGTTGGTRGTDYPKTGLFGIGGSGTITQLDAGRWPSNVIIQHDLHCVDDSCVDSCPRKLIDEQSGSRTAGVAGKRSDGVGMFDLPGTKEEWGSYEDEGGASRFFYTPKAAQAERWSYCRTCQLVFQHADESFDEHDAHKDAVVAHPTQKSLDLMRYLIRLVTRPGGTIVDPFCGTGTSAAAAKDGGFNFITCDLDPDYVKIARARVATIQLGAGAKVGASYFCPGCKAKGEVRLIERSVVERMKADNKKVTCAKCMKRYSYEELVG